MVIDGLTPGEGYQIDVVVNVKVPQDSIYNITGTTLGSHYYDTPTPSEGQKIGQTSAWGDNNFNVTASASGEIALEFDGNDVIAGITITPLVAPPPPAPTGLTAVGGCEQVALSWNVSGGATSYNVKRSTTSGGPTYTTIASPPTTSYTDSTGLADGTPYYYVVSAVGSGGESANSGQMSATTAPQIPTGLQAVATTGQILLTWTASANATSYNVYRATSSGGETTTPIASPPTAGYTDTDVASGTKYYYEVSAVNAAGQCANSSEVSATTTGLSPPTGLHVSRDGLQVYLGWNASSGATSYNLKRSTSTNAEVTITNLTATNFKDTGLASGMTYYYVVSATNSLGESGNSSEVSITMPVGLPPVPTGLQAVGGNGLVALSWTAAAGATNYNVKRSTSSGAETTIGNSSTAVYTDTNVVNGQTYYYVVSASNSIGEGDNSSEVIATPVARTAISIDFQGGSAANGTPSAMAATEYAGQVLVTNWNTAAGVSGTVSSLAQSDGTTATASVTWACNNTWSTPITESPGDYRMMIGYLDTSSSSTTTVTVANLPSAYINNGYSVYVYCDGDNGTHTKTGVYTIGSTMISATDNGGVNFSGSYVQANNSAGNFVVFTNLTSSSFTLTAVGGSSDGGGVRAPVNGIQIVAKTPSAPVGLTPPKLGGLTITGGGGGGCGFCFTNVPGASFTVYATTDLTLPVSNWPVVGQMTETKNGSYSQYQFTDPQAATNVQRFYRVTSP